MRRLALTISAVVALSLRAQDFAPVEQSAIEELARLNIRGASVAVVRGDRVIFAKGFGKANMRHGENRFSAGSEVTLVPGPGGAIRYLHTGLRAYARVP